MKSLMIAILISIGIAGCKPATEITGSWKNTNTDVTAGSVNKILVTALTSRTNARQTVENNLAICFTGKRI